MQLRKLREAAGLTQRELGNRIGVSGQAVAQWETGVKRPSVENLTKLADVLGHSSIETTRIYLISTGAEHARTLD